MNANNIITAALRKLLVVKSGGTPTANQLSDGLEVLNDMLNSWSADLNLTYESVREKLTLTSTTKEYFDIGIGSGELETARPLQLNIAKLQEPGTGQQQYDLNIVDEHQYAKYNNVTGQGKPSVILYRQTYPYGRIYFNCIPDKLYKITLTSMKELAEFPDGTTDLDLPAYYERALKTNLTIELADEFGAGNRITQSMIGLAMESKKTILGLAVNIDDSDIALPTSRQYNINSDSF